MTDNTAIEFVIETRLVGACDWAHHEPTGFLVAPTDASDRDLAMMIPSIRRGPKFVGYNMDHVRLAAAEWLRRYPDPLGMIGSKSWAVGKDRSARKILGV